MYNCLGKKTGRVTDGVVLLQVRLLSQLLPRIYDQNKIAKKVFQKSSFEFACSLPGTNNAVREIRIIQPPED